MQATLNQTSTGQLTRRRLHIRFRVEIKMFADEARQLEPTPERGNPAEQAMRRQQVDHLLNTARTTAQSRWLLRY